MILNTTLTAASATAVQLLLIIIIHLTKKEIPERGILDRYKVSASACVNGTQLVFLCLVLGVFCSTADDTAPYLVFPLPPPSLPYYF